MKVIALVGMPGSGKSEVARMFIANGYKAIRFGDVTDNEVKKRGLELNEKNEKVVREDLRMQHGMAAYAILNLPGIELALQSSNVVLDGLYSWEEYKYLMEKLGNRLQIITVWSPPQLRYTRLQRRKIRPLTDEQARSRDFAEIENINKGGPIAMADYMIKNDSTMESLGEQTKHIIRILR
ncbi:MAG: AAA family ATPase [Dehalococcoidia bacterium]|nr:AAA family ATPase [Dehalococcoidia bacterium]